MNCNKQRKYALKLFRGSKYAELRKAIKDKIDFEEEYGICFEELLLIAERARAVEHWDEFLDEWKYWAGCDWKEITDDMRVEAFKKMKDDAWKYWAGREWSCITDDMRVEAFKKMKDEEWIYYAGLRWPGITNDMRIEIFKKLKDKKWKCYVDRDWFK